MKITIDSEPVEIPGVNCELGFHSLCREVMKWLLEEKNRSILLCKIDGKVVEDEKEADDALKNAKEVYFETLPLKEAVESSVSSHVEAFEQLSEKCETLVTDCLLAEPLEIAQQWQDLCRLIKKEIGALPNLAYFLSNEEIEELVDKRFEELKALMMEVSEALPKADVVTFSDILEMKLQPWIAEMKKVNEKILENLKSVSAS